MAKVTANASLNIMELNFHDLLSGDNTQFYNNEDRSFNGVIYEDAFVTSDILGNGQYNSFILGGAGFKLDSNQNIISGSVRGLLSAITTGDELLSVNWSFEGFTKGVYSIRSASVTLDTSDDINVIKSILRYSDTFNLSPFSDLVHGYAGDDAIYGNAGNDVLYGDAGADVIDGGQGDDVLNGGIGADIMFGGSGNDIYWVERAADRIYETTSATNNVDAGGVDLIFSKVSANLNKYNGLKFVEHLTLTGLSNINGFGNDLNNTIIGNSANNVLNGGIGNDTLKGGNGFDRLIGGIGRDALYAGVDTFSDTFVFRSISESVAGGQRDRIFNFESGSDKIDIRQIDANSELAGNQVFGFATAGPAEHSIWIVTSGNSLIVKGDVDGNTKSDFEILIRHSNHVDAGDFLL